jgi:hypothetical protein
VVPDEDRVTWEDQEVLRLSDALRPWRGKYAQVPVRAESCAYIRRERL